MQHARPPRLIRAFAVAVLLALAVALAPPASLKVSAQQPPGALPTAAAGELAPPVTPTPGAASPAASETPSDAFLKKPGQRHEPKAKPSQGPAVTPTPTSPAFATLDGTWEVQVQHRDATDYSYLTLKQGENGVLSGIWKVGKTSYPLDGTYDGRLIKLDVKEPAGDVLLSGYVETASDIVGLVDYGAGKGTPVAFTAEHRARSKAMQRVY